MNVLVTGGAGYIGSHVVRRLVERGGCRVTVLDNLQKGHRQSVPPGLLVVEDIANEAALEKLFAGGAFNSVIHLAADSLVGESVTDPAKYYVNNVINSLHLLDTARRHAVSQFVFSSSAAVYGEPAVTPVAESQPTLPASPYGWSKLHFEQILQDYQRAYEMRFISLRYFNAAGADPVGDIGEDHQPESHLIPIVLQTALGKRPQVEIFGDDYDTPDGTCIRDYIHVNDLADAHILALDALEQGATSRFYNLGNGKGFSVLEVIAAAMEVTGRPIPTCAAARRPGDPGVLVAGSERAISELSWRPRKSGLREITASAWKWHESHPDGFGR